MSLRLPELGAGWSVESPAPGWFTLHESPGMAGFVARCAETTIDLADLARLAAVDPGGLGPDARVDLIAAFERARSQLEGLQQRALAAVVESTEDLGLDGEAARHEVGAALRLSPGTAHRRTRVGADLVARLPGILSALVAGDICYLQAAAVAEAVADLTDEAAAAVEARVLPGAREQTLTQTKRSVARAVHAADPAAAAERHEKAVRGRRIERFAQPEAMEGWWVTLPAHQAAAAWDRLSGQARATQAALRDGAGHDPGLDALRVDALLDAVLGHRPTDTTDTTGTTGTTDTTGGERPAPGAGWPGAGWPGPGWPGAGTAPLTRAGQVPRCRCGGAQTAAVVIDLPTLIGLAQNAGELPGYGPIPAGLARELAAERDWVRWTVDPGTRRLLDIGAARYRPSDRLRAFIAAAHRTCGFPGCARRAELCDCDHTVTFRRNGKTIVRNLGPLCRAHHNAKTHGLWQLSYHEDTGCKTWTSPLGKTYTKSMDPILE